MTPENHSPLPSAANKIITQNQFFLHRNSITIIGACFVFKDINDRKGNTDSKLTAVDFGSFVAAVEKELLAYICGINFFSRSIVKVNGKL